ncbi:MAG: glycosyltransferase family 4 protein [Candidatus Pacearchaeota archaeon]|jgi:glycosyltransferase involved in cell wall biosynthesis
MPTPKKILELTNFSAGACGVWTRVFQESKELTKKGHKVIVFSSKATKGSNQIAPETDNFEGIEIMRFPFKKLGGESFMKWFNKEAMQKALEFQPDIIIAHVYRHPHTLKALDLAKKLRKQNINCKCFLVTHAPFVEDDSTRSFFAKIIVRIYDNSIGPKNLKKFDKIIAITQWELPYLENLNVKKDRVVYIPNGIPKEFFSQKSKEKEQNKILFFGRISPIKDIETLIEAFNLMQRNSIFRQKNIILEIVGPAEQAYLEKLKTLVKQKNLTNKVVFGEPVYDLKQKIKKIDSAKIFVLSSKRDAMPQALIEVMAREKLVISSLTQGGKEIIDNARNGFLFNIQDPQGLTDEIEFATNSKNSKLINKIKHQAKKSVTKFRWDVLVKKLENLF